MRQQRKPLILAFIGVLLLSGCEHTHSWAEHFAFIASPQQQGEQEFDFNWRLSGAREVAPLQVFSSPKQLWLQFGQEQNVPAIFAVKQGRKIPLSYKRSDPYIVIDGDWEELVFRGAALEAKAKYHSPQLSSTLTSTPDTAPEPELIFEPESAQSFALDTARVKYGVAPDDGTMREALKRWAQREGWVFNDQHWEVEIDLPIVSSASFSTDFNDAVTQLMQSTALGARPLQACLYSNKVMRVIPLAQHCDPTASPASSYFSQG